MSDSLIPPRVSANDASQAAPAKLPIDDEIAELLKFEPVPRKVKRPDGWTAERQREFIHRLALCGSPARAAQQMQKNISGIEALYKAKGAESFRAAWDSALAVGLGRSAEEEEGEAYDGRAPGVNVRGAAAEAAGHEGQVLNEYGEWEDERSYNERAEEARDSICNKLVRIRRIFLQEISECPGKRAAFEILTELPIDWEIAALGQPQPDEPWRRTSQREPDMILMAESGWTAGDLGYGPDRKAQARRAIDEHRAAEGLDPVEWGE